VNRVLADYEERPEEILPFPMQNALTRPLRTAAAQQGRSEFLSLWAGQGLRQARKTTAGELISALRSEMDEAISGLQRADREDY
jgi:nitronate monooxygenase